MPSIEHGEDERQHGGGGAWAAGRAGEALRQVLEGDVSRIQHLGELSVVGMPPGEQKYQGIACIAGRGFRVRREDMKKMLFGTRGKVFTLKTLSRLVECSDLAKFKTKQP